MTYRIPTTAIIHELLDDEVIIAHLDTGVYYSLRGSGVPIWQLLVSGYAPEVIGSIFSEKFQLDISEQLSHFIDRLLSEGLLTEALAQDARPSLNLAWPSLYLPPTLEKYEEMKNLLMLDPIHEVDEQGWPSKS